MRALIVVDIQNDFLPGGALAVPNGDETVTVANRLMPYFDTVVATQDWHPENHGSFAVQHPGKKPGDRITLHGLEQTLWPVHCVQNSGGAEFASALKTSELTKVFTKGTDPKIDSYSGFFDNARRKETGLAGYLKENGVTELFVMGLATDYCVKFTVLDALSLGFRVHVVTDGVRGVNLKPGDADRALAQMQKAGAVLVDSDTIVRKEGTHGGQT